MQKYPRGPEGHQSWIQSLNEAQQAAFDKICAANQSDWPEEFRLLCVKIASGWGHISMDEYFEAIACAVQHVVRGPNIETFMVPFLKGEDELIG